LSESRRFCIKYSRISAHIAKHLSGGILAGFCLKPLVGRQRLPNIGWFLILFAARPALIPFLRPTGVERSRPNRVAGRPNSFEKVYP
jgi:hypothetical protein